jgi:hypothetical protein
MTKYTLRPTLAVALLLGIAFSACNKTDANKVPDKTSLKKKQVAIAFDSSQIEHIHIDTALYDALQLHLVHGKPNAKWPVRSYPLPGAILPFNRVVAYYGNFYSKGMGILGELPTEEMLSKLQAEARNWEAADPTIPVVPALN